MTCQICRIRVRAIGALCRRCSHAIAPRRTLLPQQIIVATSGDSEATLVDHWGRTHVLLTSTPIGRTVASLAIAILDISVSRHHARIARTRGVWSVHDAGSRNGTCLNVVPVTDHVLVHGDRLQFGEIAFFVVFRTGPRSPQL